MVNSIKTENKTEYYDELHIYNTTSINVIEEIRFSQIFFQRIYIYDAKNLIKIHKNAFRQIAKEIKEFNLYHHLPSLRSENNTDYDLNKFIDSLENCQILNIKSFQVEFQPFALQYLKKLWIDGSESLYKIRIIKDNAFYDCNQIELIIFENNNIKNIEKYAFALRPYNKQFSITFSSNQMDCNVFETKSLSTLSRKIDLELFQNEIEYFEENTFKPFLQANNKFTVSQFNDEHEKNKWFMSNGKFLYELLIRDFKLEKLLVENTAFYRNCHLLDFSELLNHNKKTPLVCFYGYEKRIFIIGDNLKVENINVIFEKLNEICSIEHFDMLCFTNIPLIDVINEIHFGKFIFDKIFIDSAINLVKIHTNAFRKIVDKIQEFHLTDLPKLISEECDYGINQLIHSLINCKIIKIQSFQGNLIPIKLSNLKQIWIDGNNSYKQIKTIEDYAFYECDQLEMIVLQNNDITEIKEFAFSFKSNSSTIIIRFRYNKLTNQAFHINSLSNINRPIKLRFEERTLQHLNKEIFKPFFEKSFENIISFSNFNIYNPKNYWIISSKIKYQITISDLQHYKSFMKFSESSNCNDNDLSLIYLRKFLKYFNKYNYDKLISRKIGQQEFLGVKISPGLNDRLKIFLNYFKETHIKSNGKTISIEGKLFSDFNFIFYILNEFIKIPKFDKLFIHENLSLESIEEINFGKVVFQEIYISNMRNLKRIHKNAFENISAKINKFYVIDVPSLTSEKDSQYDINKLINSLTNCQKLEITSFQKQFFPLKLSNLKQILFRGFSSTTKIEFIQDYAFYNCESIKEIDLMQNQINFIGENSFKMKNKSHNELIINLCENNLTAESFTENSLSHFQKPVILFLLWNHIKYLKEDVFKPFLDANQRNRVALTRNSFIFNDHRNSWFEYDEKYLSKIQFLWFYTNHHQLIMKIFYDEPITNNKLQILDLNEESIKKPCTFIFTQKTFSDQHYLQHYLQHWFYCWSCNFSGFTGICLNCTRICHKDHVIEYAKFNSFYCDCGEKGIKSCKAMDQQYIQVFKADTPEPINNYVYDYESEK